MMGRSCACKFLYGNNTTIPEKDKIDTALENKTELKTELIFYRRDGKYKCIYTSCADPEEGTRGLDP